MNTIATSGVHVALFIKLYTVSYASINISKDSAIVESLGLGINIERVATQCEGNQYLEMGVRVRSTYMVAGSV